MADRTVMYDQLPQNLKNTSEALAELADVLTKGVFDIDEIWGADAADDVTGYMDALAASSDIQDAWQTLTDGVPGGGVKQTVEMLLDGMGKIIAEVKSKQEDLSAADRLAAFNALANERDPADSYAPGSEGPFGLLPAVTGVISAPHGADIDSQGIVDAVNDLAGLAMAVGAVGIFVEYATGTMNLLNKALP